MSLQISQPFSVFADTDGSPLQNGYIYIGTSNLNPETNPIACYWDAALTLPAAQPFRTVGGYIVRNGTPASVYVNATNYSITVRNRNSALVYSDIFVYGILTSATGAALNGSASQLFSVAPAVRPENAVRLDQVGLFLSSDSPVVNGEMLVDQVNNGASIQVDGAGPFYPLDNVKSVGTAAAGIFKVQQVSVSPFAGFKNYAQVKVTTSDATPAAGSIYIIQFPIEGFNWSRFSFGTANAKTITIPIWVRSNITGTFSGSLQNGAGNRSYPFTYTISAANTPTQLALTITGDTAGTWPADNTLGAVITLDLGSGTTYQGTAGAWAAGNLFAVTGATKLISTFNATLDITGVDVVEGTVVRPYPHLTYEKVLAQCQRYLPCLNSTGTSSTIGSGFIGGVNTSGFIVVNFPVQTRIAPTGIAGASVTAPTQITLQTGGNISAASAVSINTASVYAAEISVTVAASTIGFGGYGYFNNALGQLYFTGARL